MKTNKTTNLARAIMMLVKNADINSEKTLLEKIETACYDLVDTTHNNETDVSKKLSYLHDLMILSRQVNLFLEENTIFIIGAISEISKIYETKKSSKNEEVVNEKIRDILEGGEMSQIEDTNIDVGNLYQNNRHQDIKKEIRSRDVLLETKVNNFNFENKKREVSESKNIRDIKTLENNRKLGRKEEVIRTLSYTPVSIRDIAEKVLGCSEKTIQRELNNLVDEKIANRIGEKRWSKYVLA